MSKWEVPLTWIDEVTLYRAYCDEDQWSGQQTESYEEAESEANNHDREHHGGDAG